MAFWKNIQTDIKAHGGKSDLMTSIGYILFNPSIRMLFNYRLQRLLNGQDIVSRLLQKALWMGNCRKSGCHINPNAVIAAGVKFPHPTGIVIGNGVIIEAGAIIYQNVTIGKKYHEGSENQSAPHIKSGAIIYANAVVVGDIIIAENSVIPAQSFIDKDI
jgi:serine O-acetyltransferase